MCTHVGDDGLVVDLGASWIHGLQGNPLTALVKKIKVPFEAEEKVDDEDVVFDYDGERRVWEQCVDG